MSNHQRIIITVRTDIERIEITEVHEFLIALLKAPGRVDASESASILSFIRLSLFSVCACRESDSSKKKNRIIRFIMRFFVTVIDVVRFTKVLSFADLC